MFKCLKILKRKPPIPPALFDDLDNAISELKKTVKELKTYKNCNILRPQTITYGNGDDVIRLDDSDTFLIHVDKLELGSLFTPTILVKGIEKETIKFDFYKAYKNKEGIVLHCEYRSTNEKSYKLIVHTQ